MTNTDDIRYLVTGFQQIRGVNHIHQFDATNQTKDEIINLFHSGEWEDLQDVFEINVTQKTNEDITLDVELAINELIQHKDYDMTNCEKLKHYGSKGQM